MPGWVCVYRLRGGGGGGGVTRASGSETRNRTGMKRKGCKWYVDTSKYKAKTHDKTKAEEMIGEGGEKDRWRGGRGLFVGRRRCRVN